MIRIFLCLLFYFNFSYAQSLQNLDFGTDTTFDIVSWNIEWFPKNNNTPNLVREILEKLNADIYALQEIEDTTLLKQVVANIPYYECHFESFDYGGLAYIYNSNTVQVNSIHEIFFSQQYHNAFPRAPKIFNCLFGGQEYIILNNHFKCCGDGFLDITNYTDEEHRRLQAVSFLKQYIDNNYSDKKLILLGDLNDDLSDNIENNVFEEFILDSLNFTFVDLLISQGSSLNWSFPNWPSHLDHILISNELFAMFQHPASLVSVIKIDDYMQNWSEYDANVSDHRPIGLKLYFNNNISLIGEKTNYKRHIKVLDLFGRETNITQNKLLFYIYDDGTVEKKIIFN